MNLNNLDSMSALLRSVDFEIIIDIVRLANHLERPDVVSGTLGVIGAIVSENRDASSFYGSNRPLFSDVL